MRNNAIFFVVGLLCGLSVLLFRSQPEPVVINVKDYKPQLDSLQQQHELILIHYRNVSTAYRSSLQDAIMWRKRYNDERKKKTGILTDHAYDSVLNSLYSR